MSKAWDIKDEALVGRTVITAEANGLPLPQVIDYLKQRLPLRSREALRAKYLRIKGQKKPKN